MMQKYSFAAILKLDGPMDPTSPVVEDKNMVALPKKQKKKPVVGTVNPEMADVTSRGVNPVQVSMPQGIPIAGMPLPISAY